MAELERILDPISGTVHKVEPALDIPNQRVLLAKLEQWHVPISKWGRGKAKTLTTLYRQIVTDNEARLFERVRYELGKPPRPHGVLYRRVVAIRIVHDIPFGRAVLDVHSKYRYDPKKKNVVEYLHGETEQPRILEGRCLLMEFSQQYGQGPFTPAKFPTNVSETVGFHELTFEQSVRRAWVEEFGFEPSKEELNSLAEASELDFDIRDTQHGLNLPPPLPQFFRDSQPDSSKYPGLISVKDISPKMMVMSEEHFNPDGYVEVKEEKITVLKWVPISVRTPQEYNASPRT